MRGFWGVWHAGLSQLRKKTGVISTAEGEGTANTALVYHANKLMSLHEGDLPYAVSLLYHPYVALVCYISCSTLTPIVQSICKVHGDLTVGSSRSMKSLRRLSASVYHANKPMSLHKGTLPNATCRPLLWVLTSPHGAHECTLLVGCATECRPPCLLSLRSMR